MSRLVVHFGKEKGIRWGLGAPNPVDFHESRNDLKSLLSIQFCPRKSRVLGRGFVCLDIDVLHCANAAGRWMEMLFKSGVLGGVGKHAGQHDVLACGLPKVNTEATDIVGNKLGSFAGPR